MLLCYYNDKNILGYRKMELFHGTDKKVVKAIQKEGFRLKASHEHWLGNGIYFYMDKSLAQWWTTNPTAKFGTKIENPVVLRCSISKKESELKVLNLLNLEDYEFYYREFVDCFWPKYIAAHPKDGADYKKIRCAYLDFLKALYGLDVVIGNFNAPDQPYMTDVQNDIFESLKLIYTEIQVCVFDSSIINIEEIISL